MRAHRIVLATAVVASWAGCFKSLDISKIPCDPAKENSCPSGYVCTLVAGEGYFCRRPTDAAADVPAATGEVGAVEAGRLGEVANSRLDGPGVDGAGEAGGPRIDSGLDSTWDGVADVPIGGGETGGPDLPSGTGGAGGGDGAVLPPIDSDSGVPFVAFDGGTGGAGGVLGTGGAGGTGGAPATGGATGSGGARANGSPCTLTTDCDSGKCVDGVCCDQICEGCNACTLTLTGKPDGTCAAVLAGSDPHLTCVDETATNQCGNDGLCDGKGACRKVGTSHVCTAAKCSGSVFTPASTCDGLGACAAVSSTECGVSPCSPTDGCQTTCSSDANCVGASYCDATTSTCKAKKIDGETCSLAKECASTYCIDGVCCHTDCSDCHACAASLTGQGSGTCAAVKPGTDPHIACEPDSPPCGHDGTCDGAGACRFALASTLCGAESCSGTTHTPAAYCTGGGACGTVSSATCPNNLACGATQCKTTCSSGSDCAPGFACPSVGSTSCAAACGNGSVEGSEECDDANSVTTDGCDACHVTPGWACEGAPSTCFQVIYVKADAVGANDGTSWANAYASLTAALAAASSGKAIWIAQGTYKPSTTGDRTQSFTLKDGVPIYGGFVGVPGETVAARDWQAHKTILSGDLNGDDGADFANNGENSYHVLSAGISVPVALNGLHVRGGNANGTGTGQGMGGGLYAYNQEMTIVNCVFEGNSANGDGGGIASYAYRIAAPSGAVLRNSAVKGNRTTNGNGGGLRTYGPARVTGCTFEANSAAKNGGAVHIQTYPQTAGENEQVMFVGDVFRRNTGDALYYGALGERGASMDIVQSRFEDNSKGAGGSAAGIAVSGSSVSRPTVNITETVFLGNVSSPTGTAVLSGTYANVYFRGVTAALGMGQAEVSTDSGVSTYIYDSIFRDDIGAGLPFTQGSTVQYSNTTYAYGGTNTTADPLLDANGVPANNSPVINAGSNTYLPADVGDVDGDGNTTETLPLDFAGNSRIQGGTVDMGAYEVQ